MLYRSTDWWSRLLRRKVISKWRRQTAEAVQMRGHVVAKGLAFDWLVELFERVSVSRPLAELAPQQRLAVYAKELGVSEQSSIFIWLREAFGMRRAETARKVLRAWLAQTDTIREFKYLHPVPR